jgi:TetR/AcrR family transcriptional regulator, transcriptional repressor of bet genes
MCYTNEQDESFALLCKPSLNLIDGQLVPKIVDHAARRHEIALAACRSISSRGLDNVTLAHIAQEAGYTTGMIAHYYETKWDVILAALRLMHDRLGEKLSGGIQAERSLAELLSDLLPSSPELKSESRAWLAFWAVAVSRPQLVRWSSSIHTDWRALIKRCVRAMTPAAAHWKDSLLEDVVSSIILFMDGLYVKALTRPSAYPTKDQIRLLRQHLEALIEWAERSAQPRPRTLGRSRTSVPAIKRSADL